MDKSFKDILLVESEIASEPCNMRELNYEELKEWMQRSTATYSSAASTKHNTISDLAEAVWMEFGTVLHGAMTELKEYYFFKGFLDQMNYADVLQVFKKNVVVERLQNTDEEDNQSNPEDEEINF